MARRLRQHGGSDSDHGGSDSDHARLAYILEFAAIDIFNGGGGDNLKNGGPVIVGDKSKELRPANDSILEFKED